MNTPERILIIGAHGKIGQILTKKLAASGDFHPAAFLRKAEQKTEFEGIETDTVIGDLESPVDDLTEKFKGCDAVVFTAGSGGSTGADKTLTIDLDGAVRSMEAAEKAGIKRYIIVSAAGADDRALWDKVGIKPYYVAKHYADRVLRTTELDYTILRPVRLTDDEETGRFTAARGPQGLREEITRADVAEAIFHILKHEASTGRIVEISNGEESIESALKAVFDESPVHA